jgi:hypothetical protein
MTSPLPTQHSKPAIGESKNSLQGGLLNFCVPPKGSEAPSFESLITQNDQRQEREDELEEAEAAKKRKKAQDAAAIAAQPANSGDIQREACLDLTQNLLHLQKGESAQLLAQDDLPSQQLNTQPQTDSSKVFDNAAASDMSLGSLKKDSPNNESTEAPTQKNKEATPTSEDSDLKGVLDQDQEDPQSLVPSTEDSKDNSRGMKSATSEDEMVSLSTFEDIQTPSALQAVSEPSITSTNRLSALAGLSERTAIRSMENAGSSTDNSSSNFSTGNPALIPISGSNALDKTASAQASSLLKSLAPEMEKFQQTGQSQVQLELPVGENESVKIRLSLRAGEIRSTFITESPELREALQKAWPDFTATHRAQGIRFGESQFQDSFARNQDAASEQGRQRQYQPDSSNFPASPNQSATKNRLPAIIPTATPISTKAGSVNLWA